MKVIIESTKKFYQRSYEMKVNTGKYKSRVLSNILENHLVKKYGFENYVFMTEDDFDRKDLFFKKIDDIIQYVYDNTVNIIERKRKIKVKIEDHDVISADTDLAHIILPLLEKYKEKCQSAPFVENCDVPENLQYTEEELKRFNTDGTPDLNYFERWYYVVDYMIWTFDNIIKEDEAYCPYEDFNVENFNNHQEKIDFGLYLFGKYYRSLWI